MENVGEAKEYNHKKEGEPVGIVFVATSLTKPNLQATKKITFGSSDHSCNIHILSQKNRNSFVCPFSKEMCDRI